MYATTTTRSFSTLAGFCPTDTNIQFHSTTNAFVSASLANLHKFFSWELTNFRYRWKWTANCILFVLVWQGSHHFHLCIRQPAPDNLITAHVVFTIVLTSSAWLSNVIFSLDRRSHCLSELGKLPNTLTHPDLGVIAISTMSILREYIINHYQVRLRSAHSSIIWMISNTVWVSKFLWLLSFILYSFTLWIPITQAHYLLNSIGPLSFNRT